jgi:hypothetical protein
MNDCLHNFFLLCFEGLINWYNWFACFCQRIIVGDVQVGILAGWHASSRQPCRRAGKQQSCTMQACKEVGSKHVVGRYPEQAGEEDAGTKRETTAVPYQGDVLV